MAETSSDYSVAAEALAGLVLIQKTFAKTSDQAVAKAASVLSALNEFDACIRYLNTRRSKGAVIEISSEADVQDVLYLLLRPWIQDLSYESPGDKTGNRFVIKDFASASGRFVIDAKFIRDKEHGRNISKELHDDIEMYKLHPNCDDLIFFIYDPELWIPDQRALSTALEIERTYGADIPKKLNCHVVIR